MLTKFLTSTILALVATTATAQITTVPSGCPSGGPFVLIPIGNFSIGTSTTVTVVPIGCNSTNISLFFGSCLTGGGLPLPFPPACEANCELSCLPFTVVVGPNPFIPINLAIPNDPTLVGSLEFCMQAACIGTSADGRTCVEIGDKTNVLVQ